MKSKKLLLLLVALFLTVFVATSCDNTQPQSTTTEVSPPTDHDHIYELRILEPSSCGKNGKQAYECVICGKQQHETIISPPATHHNFQYNDKLSVRPSCTTDGKKIEICYNCGAEKCELLKAEGHKWFTEVTCNSYTNYLIVTPHCTHCPFVSPHQYRYKINDVKKLTPTFKGIFGNLIYNIENNETKYVSAPFYGVYCTDTYLLIVRNTEPFEDYSPNHANLNDSPLNYYRGQGCTVVLEANISITADGLIKIVPK